MRGPTVTAILAVIALILFVCGVFFALHEPEVQISDEERIEMEEEAAENQPLIGKWEEGL